MNQSTIYGWKPTEIQDKKLNKIFLQLFCENRISHFKVKKRKCVHQPSKEVVHTSEWTLNSCMSRAFDTPSKFFIKSLWMGLFELIKLIKNSPQNHIIILETKYSKKWKKKIQLLTFEPIFTISVFLLNPNQLEVWFSFLSHVFLLTGHMWLDSVSD